MKPLIPSKQYKHLLNSFCQGFCFNGEIVLESSGLYKQSFLTRYPLIEADSTSNIQILSKTNLNPNYFAEGICLIPETKNIYQLTWKENKVLVYDVNTLSLKKTTYYPYEGWGITYNSNKKQLISSDGSKSLRYMDPDTFRVNTTYQLDVNQINELEWFKDNYILTNVFPQNLILTLDERMNNRIVKRTYLPNEIISREQTTANNVLNGIAYHKERNKIYVTGKFWKNIYELDADGFF